MQKKSRIFAGGNRRNTKKCKKRQHAELYSKCIQLKLKAADGKRYATDCFAQIRTKTIWKDGTLFCRAEYLRYNLEQIEQMPQTTFDEIVDKYVEMNIAHPFMEGNGRSTRLWLDLIFKSSIKQCVDWSQIDKKAYLQAMRESTTDSAMIRELLRGAMTDRIDDREIFMKGIDYSYYYEEQS